MFRSYRNGLIAGFGLFTALALCLTIAVAADILTVDKDGTIHLKVSDTGATVVTVNDASNPALTVTQSGGGYGAVIAGGNVGIGTAVPAAALDVNGTVNATALAGPWENSAGSTGYCDIGDMRIMWGSWSIANPSWAAGTGYHYYSGPYTLTLPASFVSSADYQIVACTSDGRINNRSAYVAFINPASSNSVNVYLAAPTNVSDTSGLTIRYSAFGTKP